MEALETKLDIKIYPPETQITGQFDGGRITEHKPLAFPGEGPEIKNTGPLFYWAWATAKGYGKIGLHPHQGFEIMSYALKGEIGHYDTLGNRSRVKAGGAQVMQTGSGVSHEEETIGDHNEFFQIWFEPDMKKSIKQSPTYREFAPEVFPSETLDGVTVKSIIGDSGPVSIKAEVTMKDIIISPGYSYTWSLDKNRSLALVVIDGEGMLFDEGKKDAVKKKDFVMVHAKEDGNITFQASTNANFRLAVIEVHASVSYPTYK